MKMLEKSKDTRPGVGRRLLQDFKKEKTDGASTYVATLISIFVMIILFLALFLNYAQVVNQNKVERIYRQYLLRMEREGYLTAADRTSLVAELEAVGLKNIDLSGTSMTAVGYGGEVRLCINGDLEIDKIEFAGGSPARKKGEIHIEIERTGTALY